MTLEEFEEKINRVEELLNNPTYLCGAIYDAGFSMKPRTLFVDRFIPKVKLNSKDAKGVYGEYLYDISKSSKCYCGIADYKECFTDHSKGCIVIHETSISSFKCLVVRLGNPTHVIILKMKK